MENQNILNKKNCLQYLEQLKLISIIHKLILSKQYLGETQKYFKDSLNGAQRYLSNLQNGIIDNKVGFVISNPDVIKYWESYKYMKK